VKRLAFALPGVLGATLAAASCNGTTGDQIIAFPAYAAGADGASEPFSVNGYTVQLTFAQMYIGAVYLDEAPPGATFDTPVCTNPGVYAAQVPGGVEVNLLSTAPQKFSVEGTGTADLAQSWELWLTDGDANNPDNSGFGIPNTVDLQGTATREADGAVFRFAATVNINQSNRGVPVTDPSQPGQNPICKQRIVALGGISLHLPIDFSTLPPVASDECELDTQPVYGDALYCIPDTNGATGLGAIQGRNLYTGIFTGGPAAYALSYSTGP
jgi:hypothetical protein